MTKEQYRAAYDNAKPDELGIISREIAKQQILTGVMRGYLAYDREKAIGWCNVNDRAFYPQDSQYDTPFHASADKKEKAIVCFEIAPTHRMKGVATALLQRAMEDAKEEGYCAIEGYPVIRQQRFEWDHAGPLRLYEKNGFTIHSQKDESIVMRKELSFPA